MTKNQTVNVKQYSATIIYLAIEAFLFGSHPSDFNQKLGEEKSETSRLSYGGIEPKVQ